MIVLCLTNVQQSARVTARSASVPSVLPRPTGLPACLQGMVEPCPRVVARRAVALSLRAIALNGEHSSYPLKTFLRWVYCT